MISEPLPAVVGFRHQTLHDWDSHCAHCGLQKKFWKGAPNCKGREEVERQRIDLEAARIFAAGERQALEYRNRPDLIAWAGARDSKDCSRGCPECGSALAIAYFDLVVGRVLLSCSNAACIWFWSNWGEPVQETCRLVDESAFPLIRREAERGDGRERWGVWYAPGPAFRTFTSREFAEDYLKANPPRS